MRLLIVDDEKATRETLNTKIDWSLIGIDEISVAKNGVDALEICQKYTPDIVLSDIRMPKMDGIQLGYEIRKKYTKCKLIYLSGYCDKEYLKSAIDLKVMGYIEKPIDLECIKELVLQTVNEIQNERKNEDSRINLETLVSNNQVAIQQRELYRILINNGEIDEKLAFEKLFQIPYQLDETHVYCVASLVVNFDLETEDKIRVETYDLLAFRITKEFRQGITSCICCKDKNKLVVLLYKKNIPTESVCITKVWGDLFNFASNVVNNIGQVTIGYYKNTSQLNDLSSVYEKAVKIADGQFYQGSNRILSEECNMDKGFYEFSNNDLQIFQTTLASGKKDALQYISTLTGKIMECQDRRIEYIKDIYYRLFSSIYSYHAKVQIMNTGNEIADEMWDRLHQIELLSQLEKFLYDMIELIPEVGYFYSNEKICEIDQYIRSNYQDSKLSVGMIADHFYLTKNYLCALYKKETGKTINEYITEVRMEMAKQLLKQKCKLYEVAHRVGLDPNYFSTLFKKYEDCSPSEYRERY